MLKNKIAVITGSASGIGKATAEIFVRENIEGIAIVDYNYEAACKTAEELGACAFPVRCDVSDPDQVDAAIAQIMERFGRIDILVNNAAITRDAIFHKMTREQWLQVINTNLNSVFYWTHGVYPQMRERGYGRIINMSSNAAKGNPGQCNYSATKAAVVGFANTLAKEAARKGITVNCVAPGPTQTGWIDEDFEKVVAPLIPMGNLIQPQDIAETILFLASEQARMITGQVIKVSGGKAL